jgi:hypothetical protein
MKPPRLYPGLPFTFYLVLPGAARPIAFCSKFMYVNNTAMMFALLTE